MKRTPNLTVERYRVRDGEAASSRADGNNGMFKIPLFQGPTVGVVVSDGAGWDHVSVSLPDRCPTWEEMCAVKEMFFEPGECVIEYHPPRSDYRNYHQFCLHLWRPQDATIPRPPGWMVAWGDDPTSEAADAIAAVSQRGAR